MLLMQIFLFFSSSIRVRITPDFIVVELPFWASFFRIITMIGLHIISSTFRFVSFSDETLNCIGAIHWINRWKYYNFSSNFISFACIDNFNLVTTNFWLQINCKLWLKFSIEFTYFGCNSLGKVKICKLSIHNNIELNTK